MGGSGCPLGRLVFLHGLFYTIFACTRLGRVRRAPCRVPVRHTPRELSCPFAPLVRCGFSSRSPHSQPRALRHTLVLSDTMALYRSVSAELMPLGSLSLQYLDVNRSVCGARAPRPPYRLITARAASARAYARSARRPWPAWYWVLEEVGVRHVERHSACGLRRAGRAACAARRRPAARRYTAPGGCGGVRTRGR